MREIKFRAWDGVSMYLSPSLLEGAQHVASWFEAHSTFGASGKESQFMQYTDTKDKNDREVFKGDVVKFWYWSTYEQRSFPEYVDFRETEMKEGKGVIYWNETELTWHVRPCDNVTVYHGSSNLVRLEEMPLIYAGLTMEAISEWVGEYEASEEDLEQYTGRDGIEVIGNIYQNPELINPSLQP